MKYILLFNILIFSINLNAGPFLTINKINSKKEFPKINLTLTVQNLEKHFISGLNESNISVYEDGYKINYINVTNLSDANDYLYLVFSVDSSNSISNQFLKSIKSNAVKIINSAGPKDKIAIYKFNDSVKLLNSFESNKNLLISNIEKIKKEGESTLLYNSIYDSVDLLSKIKSDRKIIIVFTDGKDEGSSINSTDIIKFANKYHIPVHFICLKSSNNIKTLARISKLTGGNLVYSKNHDEIIGMYKTILSLIKNRYIIQYISQNTNKSKNHEIEVRLKYGNIRDRDTINYKHDAFSLNSYFFTKINSLLLILIGFLILILITTIIFFIKRERKKIIELCNDNQREERMSSYLNKIKYDETLTNQKDQILSSIDSEYHYSDAWLVEKDGPDSGKKYPIFWEEITIGRGKESSIVVKDDSVSLKHSKIKSINNIFYLFDLASDNGTYLNEKKLLRPKAIYDWDEIKIGRTLFIFRGSKT